jgi:hypothetical protein
MTTAVADILCYNSREDDYYPSEVRTMAPPSDERTNDCEIIVHNKKQR